MMQQRITICQSSSVSFKQNQQIYAYCIFIKNNITYLICQSQFIQNKFSLIMQQQQNQYICVFIEYINLHYFSKLQKLIAKISKYQGGTYQQKTLKIAIYQIKYYTPINYRVYKLGKESYGDQILIKNSKSFQRAFFSNCFKQEGYYYYFLDYFEKTSQQQQFGLIISHNDQYIYGINLKLRDISFCLPFYQIMCKSYGSLIIDPIIEPILRKVVYVNCNSSMCTGILLSQNIILTVRHAFADSNPTKGTIVNVRLYPYKINQRAILIKHGSDKLDIAMLQLISEQITVKQYKAQKKQKKNQLNALVIGSKVYGIGFGKYDYYQHLFDQFNDNQYLPTLSIGYISKTLNHNNYPIYFKTSLQLSNGFSGCGIWQNSKLLGMATFIIKNKISDIKYGNHNFSLLTQYLLPKFIDNGEINLDQNQDKFVKMVNQIKSRFQLKLHPKL